MDKEKTYKETPKQKKSASGIWEWIFWLLFASVVIVVVIGAFGNSIWYVLTGKEHRPEDTMTGGGWRYPVLRRRIQQYVLGIIIRGGTGNERRIETQF